MTQLIAIDIGGTRIKYGRVTLTGEILMHGEIPSEARLGGEHLLQRVASLVNSLKNDNDVRGLAISTAGQINAETGEVLYASSAIPGYQGLNLKHYFESHTGLQTEVDNDVNCALIGECWLGAGQQLQNGLMITIGTGIGGAIWLDGQLYRGLGYSAGEWGYMTVNGHCFQNIASTSALIEQVAHLRQQPVDELDGYQIWALAKSDPLVERLLIKYFECLAEGVANLMYVFDPQMIILGGGIAQQKDFITQLSASLIHKVPPHLWSHCCLKAAYLGNQAGFCGAAKYFIDKHVAKLPR